ncbi:hypothetical protein GCM10023115_05070 [Pontixanthobacter gangjinensis]
MDIILGILRSCEVRGGSGWVGGGVAGLLGRPTDAWGVVPGDGGGSVVAQAPSRGTILNAKRR